MLIILGLALALVGCASIKTVLTNQDRVSMVAQAAKIGTQIGVGQLVKDKPELAPTINVVASTLKAAANGGQSSPEALTQLLSDTVVRELSADPQTAALVVHSLVDPLITYYGAFYKQNINSKYDIAPYVSQILLAIADGATNGCSGVQRVSAIRLDPDVYILR